METKNLRKRGERRNAEKGPPVGWQDRRRRAERRQIEVEETGFDEWVAAAKKFLAKTQSPKAYNPPHR